MKKLNQQVLEQVIKLTIRGESDRAAKLMEKYMAAKGAFLVNEENYAGDDPMFPARRELQRELEDDLETDRVDTEGDEALDDIDSSGVEGGIDDLDGGDCEEGDCAPEAVAQMIQDLITAGGLDEDKLAKIVSIIASDDDVEGDGLDDDGEVPEEVPSSDDVDPELNGPVDGEVPDVQPEEDEQDFR